MTAQLFDGRLVLVAELVTGIDGHVLTISHERVPLGDVWLLMGVVDE